jgi:hypothetical protein
MNCRRTKEYLWEFSKNLLPPDLRIEINRHLELCGKCRLLLDNMDLVDEELECFGEIVPSSYFDQKLNAGLDELQRQRDSQLSIGHKVVKS